ncbi:MAG: hypothetical protein ACFFBP_09700 [Promethearchaeota archaeon]
MSPEENRCENCGRIAEKEDKYCMGCGAEIKPIKTTATDIEAKPRSLISENYNKLKNLKPGFKVLIFFIIVTIADLITSLIVTVSAGLPLEAYWILFFGLYILFLIIGGIIFRAVSVSDYKNHLAKGIGYMILAVMIIVIIVLPIYLLAIFPSILGSISISMPTPPWLQAILDQINNAIGQAMYGLLRIIFYPFVAMFEGIGQQISQSVEQSLDDIEVPGFEPILLLSVFVVISIIIIYKYHLNVKKSCNNSKSI